jgi:glycosyltransferase involved in cell wall biosynthesis
MKVLVMNLNGRWWMLHYSSQFCNALAQVADMRVVVPSYADTALYDSKISFFKIRTNPTFLSFLYDSINIFAHISLMEKIWKFRPDIIQIIDNHPWYFFYPLLWKLLGSKIYVIQHDPFPHSGEQKWLFHAVAIWVNSYLRKIADLLIVHGENMRTKAIKVYSLDPKKVRSIYHGSYNLFQVEEYAMKDPKPHTFLFFGRIVAYKWLDILLQALIFLEQRNINYHAIIAWDGDIWKYASWIWKIPTKKLTLMNRFIEDSEISSIFHKANFVVLPYKDATASWIIPLAYSFHLAVIATKVGVLPDYVEDGKTGILIEANNAGMLAEALEQLLSRTTYTKELWENAYQFQKNKLSWESIIHAIYYAK